MNSSGGPLGPLINTARMSRSASLEFLSDCSGNAQMSRSIGQAISACSEVLEKDSWLSHNLCRGSPETKILLEKLSPHLGKHGLIVSDAMFATKANPDTMQASSNHSYFMAIGCQQVCSVQATDGRTTTLPSRHVRKISEGDRIACNRRQPILIMRVRAE